MTDAAVATPTPPTAAKRPRTRIGITALVIALFTMVAPVVAVVLGIVSLSRTGSTAPGIVAIIIGVIGSFGLFGLPVVLSEIVPGF
jgi:hypothetical protein